MNLGELIFGARPPRSIRRAHEQADLISAPPHNVTLRRVRPRPQRDPVRAWRAEADRKIETARGALTARGGKDMIVAHGPNDYAVVRRDIFDRTYAPIGDGLYKKRDDILLHYFTLDHDVTVETLEGHQRAEAGDWIMVGVCGELWPVREAKALEKYQRA